MRKGGWPLKVLNNTLAPAVECSFTNAGRLYFTSCSLTCSLILCFETCMSDVPRLSSAAPLCTGVFLPIERESLLKAQRKASEEIWGRVVWPVGGLTFSCLFCISSDYNCSITLYLSHLDSAQRRTYNLAGQMSQPKPLLLPQVPFHFDSLGRICGADPGRKGRLP